MKSYTLQIGEGLGDAMMKVTFSDEIFADSLGEAIDKAKALTRTRLAHTGEYTVHVIDADQSEQPVLWARSIEEARNG